MTLSSTNHVLEQCPWWKSSIPANTTASSKVSTASISCGRTVTRTYRLITESKTWVGMAKPRMSTLRGCFPLHITEVSNPKRCSWIHGSLPLKISNWSRATDENGSMVCNAIAWSPKNKEPMSVSNTWTGFPNKSARFDWKSTASFKSTRLLPIMVTLPTLLRTICLSKNTRNSKPDRTFDGTSRLFIKESSGVAGLKGATPLWSDPNETIFCARFSLFWNWNGNVSRTWSLGMNKSGILPGSRFEVIWQTRRSYLKKKIMFEDFWIFVL